MGYKRGREGREDTKRGRKKERKIDGDRTRGRGRYGGGADGGASDSTVERAGVWKP